MTKSEALSRLGLTAGSVTADVVQRAYLMENKRLLTELTYPPRGKTKGEITQEIVLLKEARDTLMPGGVSALPPTSPVASSGSTGNPAPPSPVSTTPVSGSNPTTQGSFPSFPPQPPNPWISNALQGLKRLSERAAAFVSKWVATRYNRQTWDAFVSEVLRIPNDSFQLCSGAICADLANPSFPICGVSGADSDTLPWLS